jgi:hypothetical protein
MTMKLSIALFVALLPVAAAGQPAAKSARPSAQAAPRALEVPAGAVETEPGTFRFTDAQGRKWIYRKTPFGVARLEEGAAAAAPAAVAERKEEAVKVVEKGDSVHFERPGPFGIYKWERKKSDLTDAERGWVEQARTRVAGRETSR